MKFVNKTGNSIYLADIDKTIPYLGENEQSIDADDIKKSQILQELVISKNLEIIEISEDRMEQNLLRRQCGDYEPLEDSLPVAPVEVCIRGHFYNNTSYAKTNRNLALSLAHLGVEICIDPVSDLYDGLNQMEIQHINLLRRPPRKKFIYIHSSVPSLAQVNPEASYSILYTTVESPTVPSDIVSSCNSFDEVWVTSDFCKNVLSTAGVKNVSVVPCAVDHRLYVESVAPHVFTPKLKPYIFVSVFSWNYRKGYDALLKAYLKEFTSDDDVSLLIVTKYQCDQNNHRRGKVEAEIKQFISDFGGAKPAHIARCGREIPEFEMPKLYRACNCFVLPTRGEGFGLPYMEASLCGLPVIATNHSGQTMFLNFLNSYLLEIDKISKVSNNPTNVHYWDSESFPELTDNETIVKLGKLMRYVYQNPEDAKAKNQRLQEEIVSKYTCESVGTLAKKKLEETWRRL
jgi:glycosyltransferase involved in cell wall biosynthesis